jgi:RNA polymerase sigma-70 factor (ECF subfamily)
MTADVEHASAAAGPYGRILRDGVMQTGDRPRVDLELLQRIGARDPDALGELYDRHARLLFGLILRILRSRPEAEEVLQEVFVQIWTKVDAYSPTIGAPLAWLVRIARNRAIDRLRANQVRDRTLQALTPEPSPPYATRAGAQSVEQLAVLRALSSLSPEQRDLIELAYFEGLTHAELAERFGLPLGTVKTRVRNGLLALRRDLGAPAQTLEAQGRLS